MDKHVLVYEYQSRLRRWLGRERTQQRTRDDITILTAASVAFSAAVVPPEVHHIHGDCHIETKTRSGTQHTALRVQCATLGFTTRLSNGGL